MSAQAQALAWIEQTPGADDWIRAEAWRLGQLDYLLRDYQLPGYHAAKAAIADPTVLKFALDISRRWGKTFVLCLIAIELAVTTPNARIRFAAPTLDELAERVIPICEEILADCPEHLRPVWRRQRKAFIFPNGALIRLAGVNNQGARKLRGSGAELFIIDEGGFIDEVTKLIKSVAIPQLLDTHGTLLGGSTPPESPAHEYVDFYRECKAAGNWYHADVYSMVTEALTPETVDMFAADCGGYGTVTFRREYLSEYVADEELVVIPDFRQELHVRPVPMPDTYPFWHKYVAMDIGATRRDFTAVLFAHYHYKEATVYVERVLIDSKLPRMRSPQLAKAIRAIECDLWGEHAAPSRWSDNNNVELLVELATDPDHPVMFRPTSKDELPAMVQNARDWFARNRVAIGTHESCKQLAECVRDGTWKGTDWIGREFDRTSTLGHLDALAALIYLLRNIDERQASPIPANWGLGPDQLRIRRETERDRTLDDWYGRPRGGLHS